MLSSKKRGIDYFSRGVNEILSEAKIHSHLDIEENLMLVYKRDFFFYLSNQNSHLQSIIKKSLRQAKYSGLMDKLIQDYWGESFKNLKLERRIRIDLETP